MYQFVHSCRGVVVRFTKFTVIGGGVFAVGLALQYGLVEGLHMNITAAFVTQLVITVVLNYELNRRATWSDRRHNRVAYVRFMFVQFTSLGIAWVAFVLFIQMPHVHYLSANMLATAVATCVKYTACDLWAFQRGNKDVTGRQDGRMGKALAAGCTAGCGCDEC